METSSGSHGEDGLHNHGSHSDTVSSASQSDEKEEIEAKIGHENLSSEELNVGQRLLLFVGACTGAASVLFLCKRNKNPETYVLLEHAMTEI